ncbi:MAG: DmsC/YnfH family molybdoenzyme membrane anchor subunit [Acidobacteriota bacterium]
MLKEWPLVAFTILGQTAAGAILVLSAILLFFAAPGWSLMPARHLVLTVLEMALVLLGIAAALSFFHLRFPFRAFRVLANLRTSWLSREILCLLALLALIVLADILVRTGNAADLSFSIVMGALAVDGVLFLVSMSKIYMLRSVPSWEPGYTGLSFFLTAGTLGAMATAWITGTPPGNPYPLFSGLWLLSSLMIAVDVLVESLETPVFGLDRSPAPSLRPPTRVPRRLHFGRLALLAGGLILIILSLAETAPTAHPAAGPIGSRPTLNLAFVLVLMGAVAGRFLFYGLVPRPGD